MDGVAKQRTSRPTPPPARTATRRCCSRAVRVQGFGGTGRQRRVLSRTGEISIIGPNGAAETPSTSSRFHPPLRAASSSTVSTSAPRRPMPAGSGWAAPSDARLSRPSRATQSPSPSSARSNPRPRGRRPQPPGGRLRASRAENVDELIELMGWSVRRQVRVRAFDRAAASWTWPACWPRARRHLSRASRASPNGRPRPSARCSACAGGHRAQPARDRARHALITSISDGCRPRPRSTVVDGPPTRSSTT